MEGYRRGRVRGMCHGWGERSSGLSEGTCLPTSTPGSHLSSPHSPLELKHTLWSPHSGSAVPFGKNLSSCCPSREPPPLRGVQSLLGSFPLLPFALTLPLPGVPFPCHVPALLTPGALPRMCQALRAPLKLCTSSPLPGTAFLQIRRPPHRGLPWPSHSLVATPPCPATPRLPVPAPVSRDCVHLFAHLLCVCLPSGLDPVPPVRPVDLHPQYPFGGLILTNKS